MSVDKALYAARLILAKITMYATNKMQQIPFIDLSKSGLHVSDNKLANLQEHFLTVYTVKKCS